MLLKEMFSAIGAPTSEQEDVDWTNDLKFFIDNDDAVLKNQIRHVEKVSVLDTIVPIQDLDTRLDTGLAGAGNVIKRNV